MTACVLPVLPALLSASATGGRRRPLGIVAGLAVTYTIAISALASVIDGVGLADDTARTLAVAVLFAFGLVLLVPRLREPFERWLAPLSRFGPRSRGDGFWSGLGVGGALGFLYAPCAGPILAAVVSVSATRGSSLELIVIALAFSLGSAAVLLAFALGGRGVAAAIRRAGRGVALQRAVGVVLVATAALMLAQVDVRFQTALANHFPSFLVNPSRSFERSSAVGRRLADLRGKSRFDSSTATAGGGTGLGLASSLPVLGPAPAFRDTQRWFNTGGRSLSLRELRGHVVLIDFWTYTCINCIRTLPALKAWYSRYHDKGLEIVGVHTPEFSFEHDAGNVAAAIAQNSLRYPVVQDNDYGTREAYGNQYWPAEYLRYTHFAEGSYGETEAAIRELLREAGSGSLGRETGTSPELPSRDLRTPETYVGFRQAQRFLPSNPRLGTATYRGYPGTLPLSHFTLTGRWDVSAESATAVTGASIRVRFGARRVYLVLSSAGARPRRVRVLLDGSPVQAGEGGRDVQRSAVVVQGQRLYSLVSLPRVERRELTLELEPGLSAYAFTFG